MFPLCSDKEISLASIHTGLEKVGHLQMSPKSDKREADGRHDVAVAAKTSNKKPSIVKKLMAEAHIVIDLLTCDLGHMHSSVLQSTPLAKGEDGACG